MKFFRDQPFRVQATFLLALFFLLFTGQFYFLYLKFSSISDLSDRIELSNQARLTYQQIALVANEHIHGGTSSLNIQDYIDQHDYLLKVLSEGGIMADSRNEIKPLPESSRNNFEELNLRWNSYKENLLNYMTGTQSQAIAGRLKKRIGAQWTSVSGWHEKLTDNLLHGLQRQRSNLYIIVGVFGLADMAIMLLVYFGFIRQVLRPLKAIETNTSEHAHTTGLPQNELGSMASKVNEVIEQLRDATDFVKGIGEGNLSMNYSELDVNYSSGKNLLADSLIAMQARLKEMNEEEQKRKWANEGLTQFVDILRTSGEDIAALGDRIISALVKYTRSNQGGLYNLNDDDPANKHLELISLFAFDKKKYEKQQVKPGEGILGQTFVEKKTTCITEVPEDYVRIRSGLGGATPKSVLVVPLKIDQEVYGVVELASFNAFEAHEIAFVEKLGEAIASTLATVKAAHRNRKLLEKSNEAAEQMRSQEEEMRQNMEELQATQEEMARKERDYVAKIRELESRIGDTAPGKELEEAKKMAETQRRDYEAQIKALKDEKEALSAPGAEWKLAEEVERTLRINLEALKITRDELDRPS